MARKKGAGKTRDDIRRFGVPAGLSVEELLERLHASFRLCSESDASCLRRYYDSFDWLLYRAGSALYAECEGAQNQLRWERLDDGRLKRLLRRADVPHFAGDLPPGPFREELAPVLKLRALLPVVEVRSRRRVLHLLDGAEKTVARLVVEDERTARDAATGRSAPLEVLLRVDPVRGYEGAGRSLRAFLRDLGLPADAGRPLLTALEAVGRTAGDYSSGFDVKLDPQMRADEAARLILRTLLQTLEVNESGLRKRLDTEFLHDFRVAIRRTRAVLRELKEVFPAPVLDRFRPAFKELGRATGPVRDLDVYLLGFASYQAWLPDAVQAHLTPLRGFLESQQEREHARLIDLLDAQRYRTLLNDWRAYLDAAADADAASREAARPILKVASRRTWRAYRKVMKQGRALLEDPAAPPQELHELRISCKRLRYLLELFASIYPPGAIKHLIRALKRLQDNLGDFQDYAVQQRKIHRFAVQMQEAGETPPETLLAMGRLESHLEFLQRQAREAFADRFRRFARRKTRRRFERLFKKHR